MLQSTALAFKSPATMTTPLVPDFIIKGINRSAGEIDEPPTLYPEVAIPSP